MSAPPTGWNPYCGPAPTPGEWLGRWNLDPVLLAGLALAFFLLWRNGADRRLAAGALGLSFLLFVSPFCALSSALFSARVAHHVLLMTAIAPLLLFSLPPGRLRIPGPLTLWTAVQALVFWLWHAPPAYSAALSSDSVYWLMQSTLFVSAVGFWSALRRSAELGQVAALLVTLVQMGLLGALITLSPDALYAPHFSSTAAWGMGPLDDQQVAGLIMWVPAAGIYLAAALFIAHRWLARESGPATA